MKIALLTASYGICEILVKTGIEANAFFWHVKEEHPTKAKDANGNLKYVYNVYEVEGGKYIPVEYIPAWTMEELYVMLGGDQDKPDLLPIVNVQVLNDDEKKEAYYNYEYNLVKLTSARKWTKVAGDYSQGANACAELLRDHLARTPEAKRPEQIKLINQRYKFFFNEK